MRIAVRSFRTILLAFGAVFALPAKMAMAAPFSAWVFALGGTTVDCTVYNNLPNTFFTVRIVMCIESYIRAITYYFLDYTSDFFLPLTYALIALVMTLFGIKLASQGRELKTEGLMLLIKIGLVLTFCYSFGSLAPDAFAILEDSVGFVMQVMKDSLNGGCALTDYGGLLGPTGANLAGWAKLDCIIGEIIGFGPKVMMAGALFGMLGSMLFSGSLGIMIFFIGIFVLISLLMFVLRAVYIYFLAYIMLAMMIIISPMVIPLILLPKTVREVYCVKIFDAWLGYIFNSMITPLVLFAYLAIAFPMFDFFVVSDANPSSLVNVLKGTYTVDGKKRPANPNASPGNYYELADRCFKMTSFTDPSFYNKLGADYLDRMTEGDITVPMRSGQNDLAQFFPDCSGLDFGKEQQQRLTEIAFGLLQVMFAGYLLLTMMKLIPGIAGQLSGGGGSALTNAANSAMGIEGSVSNSMQQSQGFVSKVTGSDYSFSSLVGRRP